MLLDSKVCVIGAGAWGTTIANLLAKKGNLVYLWDHNPAVFENIKYHSINDQFLPGFILSGNIIPCQTLSEAMDGSDHIILAIPSKYVYDVLAQVTKTIPADVSILVLTKGMILDEKPIFLTDMIQKAFPQIPLSRLAVLSGPNFALEIARELPAATVLACTDPLVGKQWQEGLSASYFRVYSSSDIIGVQLGGIMKNVIALAAGILDGKMLGMNVKSALIVRGISEMARLFKPLGCKTETLYGLSGLGDLIATCQSELSRNHWAGMQIGAGQSLTDLLAMGRTVEGIDSVPAVLKLASHFSIDLPICKEINEIIFKGKEIHQSIEDLMKRTLKTE